MLVHALRQVFRKPAYAILGLSVSAWVFALAAWLPNIRLIAGIAGDWDIPLQAKLELPLSLLGSIATNFTLFTASYTVAIALLSGIYAAMMAYFLRRRVREARQGAAVAGIMGVASGIVGTGCAACGSFLLTAFSLAGASGMLAILPLKGGEFGILGILLLAAAVYLTARQIENPAVCKI